MKNWPDLCAWVWKKGRGKRFLETIPHPREGHKKEPEPGRTVEIALSTAAWQVCHRTWDLENRRFMSDMLEQITAGNWTEYDALRKKQFYLIWDLCTDIMSDTLGTDGESVSGLLYPGLC